MVFENSRNSQDCEATCFDEEAVEKKDDVNERECTPDHQDDRSRSCPEIDEVSMVSGDSNEIESTVVVLEKNGSIQDVEDREKEDEKDSEKDGEKKENERDFPQAPDGGYGWIIVLGVFVNNMIYGGLSRSEGLFYLHFQSKFNSSAQLTAWPLSLMTTINLFMGPVCGALSSRYSVRTAFIVGTLLSVIGIFLTGFATSIYFIFLTLSLLSGFGRGLFSGVLLLNLYFDKHRSLATGLGSSGVGFGTFWLVPLIQFFFDTYGFTGSFLLQSGIALNGLVVAMLFRPLSMHHRFLMAKRRKNQPNLREEEGEAETMIQKDHMQIHQQGHNLENNHDLTAESTNSVGLHSPSYYEHKEKCNGPTVTLPVISNGNIGFSSASSVARKRKEDNFLKSSLKIIFPIEHNRKGVSKKATVFHWHLLKHVPFLVFCTSNFLFVLAFKIAFMFMPALVNSKGLSQTEAALILTISGALDTFGRIAVGFLMDIRVLRPMRPHFFILFLLVIAGASFIVPFLESFTAFGLVSAVYGFMTGAFISQRMVVLVDLLGREQMPSSFGIQKFFQGLGTLIGPPLAGALKDSLGDYDSAFYLGGASMVGAGLLMILSNLLFRLKDRQDKKRSSQTE